MTVIVAFLLIGTVLYILSAITGIQSIYTTRTGTIITYWHGYWRLLALVYAAILALALYGIYRRYLVVWKIGFIVWYLIAAVCIFQAWRLLLPQPYGWVGATAVTVVTPLVALYWATWWRRQKDWFFGDDEQET
jgi:hypothetical protein